jgi:membrane fusion protein (multidrug efflux system)
MQLRQVIITLIFLAVLVGVVFISRQMVGSTQNPEQSGTQVEAAPLRRVKTQVVQNETHTLNKRISGMLVAAEQYGIYSEVPGRMMQTRVPFRKGNYFEKGALLLSLDKETETLNLISRKNQLYNTIAAMIPDLKIGFPESADKWDTYLRMFDETAELSDFPGSVSEKEKLFISGKTIYQQFFQIKAEEERLKKYVVRAPFSGRLTEALVLPGSYVQPGQKLGELTGSNLFEIEMTIDVDDLKYTPVGKAIRIENNNWENPLVGQVDRINPIIDPQNQMVTVIVNITGDKLFHGMYVEGELQTSPIPESAAVDRNLILGGSTVFLVEADSLVRRPVEVVGVENGTAFVRGLQDGERVLAETSPTFRPGMQVQYSTD